MTKKAGNKAIDIQIQIKRGSYFSDNGRFAPRATKYTVHMVSESGETVSAFASTPQMARDMIANFN